MTRIRFTTALLALFPFNSLSFTSVSFAVHPTTFLSEQKTNWAEYKHDYVDPLTPHQVESKIHDHIDPQKRAVSDKYWMKQMEQDKAKLHEMSSEPTDNGSAGKPLESFQHYKHENIDPITPHETPSPVTSHLDPMKRQNADKYWRAVYIDEKEKLRSKKRP